MYYQETPLSHLIQTHLSKLETIHHRALMPIWQNIPWTRFDQSLSPKTFDIYRPYNKPDNRLPRMVFQCRDGLCQSVQLTAPFKVESISTYSNQLDSLLRFSTVPMPQYQILNKPDIWKRQIETLLTLDPHTIHFPLIPNRNLTS